MCLKTEEMIEFAEEKTVFHLYQTLIRTTQIGSEKTPQQNTVYLFMYLLSFLIAVTFYSFLLSHNLISEV